MNTSGQGDAAVAQRLIPAAFERRPTAPRQAGVMGGPAFGSPDAPVGPLSMDAATIAEREKEGGGGVSQRRARRSFGGRS